MLYVGLLGMTAKLCKTIITCVTSVCPVRPRGTTPTGWVFVKLDIWVFCENMSRKFKFHQHLTNITGTLLEDLCTFMIMSCQTLLRIWSVSDKSRRETQITNFMFSNSFSKNCAICKIVEHMVDLDRPQTIRRMRFACWITKATHTHSEYVILTAFPQQQRLRECAWVLRYTYIACLVCTCLQG
jgi:hypothetical protein